MEEMRTVIEMEVKLNKILILSGITMIKCDDLIRTHTINFGPRIFHIIL